MAVDVGLLRKVVAGLADALAPFANVAACEDALFAVEDAHGDLASVLVLPRRSPVLLHGPTGRPCALIGNGWYAISLREALGWVITPVPSGIFARDTVEIAGRLRPADVAELAAFLVSREGTGTRVVANRPQLAALAATIVGADRVERGTPVTADLIRPSMTVRALVPVVVLAACRAGSRRPAVARVSVAHVAQALDAGTGWGFPPPVAERTATRALVRALTASAPPGLPDDLPCPASRLDVIRALWSFVAREGGATLWHAPGVGRWRALPVRSCEDPAMPWTVHLREKGRKRAERRSPNPFLCAALRGADAALEPVAFQRWRAVPVGALPYVYGALVEAIRAGGDRERTAMAVRTAAALAGREPVVMGRSALVRVQVETVERILPAVCGPWRVDPSTADR